MTNQAARVGLGFYPGYFFLSSYILFRQLTSELTERNSAKTCHAFGSKPDSKKYVENLSAHCP